MSKAVEVRRSKFYWSLCQDGSMVNIVSKVFIVEKLKLVIVLKKKGVSQLKM